MSKAFLFRGSSTSYIAVPNGLWWPYNRLGSMSGGNTGTMDAAAEKYACIGRLYINGRPTTTRTLDTSGSSKIGFQCATPITFANASTSVDIGIQGVTTTGPAAQPDGAYTVKAVVTTAANTTPSLASNTWCEAVPTTGTATLTHGDLIAVVFDMTARGGVDSILLTGSQAIEPSQLPLTNANAAAAWGATGVNSLPNMMITFSDGTLGWIDGQKWVGLVANRTWTDATNPDERGLIFQVPFDCKVDVLATHIRIADANGDFIISLYSTPESGATSLASVTVDSSQLGTINVDGTAQFQLATEVNLARNTDYCVAIKASGSGNIRWNEYTLGLASHRALFGGGTTVRSVTRNGGSGDFSGSSTTLMNPLWARISAIKA